LHEASGAVVARTERVNGQTPIM